MKITSLQSVCILLLLISFSNCNNYKAIRKTSFENIEMLKNNVLLVRLKSVATNIEALKKAGKNDRAEKVKQLNLEENQKTIAAFRDVYDFSKVYFFEASEATNLKQGKFDQVILLDENSNKVEDLTFLEEGYLVATFGKVYQDQFIYTDDNNVRHSVGGTSSLPALVVMDSEYVQLKKPFPSRVMTTFREAAIQEAVVALDRKLMQFYLKYQRKKTRF